MFFSILLRWTAATEKAWNPAANVDFALTEYPWGFPGLGARCIRALFVPFPSVFDTSLLQLLTACISMNERVFSWSVCASPAFAQQSRRRNKARQQEIIKETTCDERAACSISNRRCEDASCVLSDSDVPPRSQMFESWSSVTKGSLPHLTGKVSSVDIEHAGESAAQPACRIHAVLGISKCAGKCFTYVIQSPSSDPEPGLCLDL